ncbi:SLOG family protein [Nocardia rhizosphaerihabitans]|uniref:SLOG family protein n=1 Tax=Nocardia rhizosphaerihabitans TaxID=1691570 RepID=UPI00366C68E6
MRVLVTGSRDLKDERTVIEALHELLDTAIRERRLPMVVVHGDCPTGADAVAHGWTRTIRSQYVIEEAHPADWVRFGKAAGPLRNAHMVSLGADICIAFPRGESRGTRGCMELAEAAGIEVDER